jgi:hypothetical protein
MGKGRKRKFELAQRILADGDAGLRRYFEEELCPTEDEIKIGLDLGLLRQIQTPVLGLATALA